MSDFTESDWRVRADAKLQQFKQWLSHGEAPYLAYGTIAGLSLWPLVEAAGQAPPGQLPYSLILALGSIAGGVGTNLIAEQLQYWRDRAEPVTENEVITWIQDNVAAQPDLLPAVDAIIAKLDAIPTVQIALSVSDQEWFTQTLRQELSQLGNGPKYSAVLHGSGSIAQGKGATAVGERGVNVQGSVTGSINTGDRNEAIQAQGDVVKGDKVGGDKVGGDKIAVGDISGSSGIAIGRGASAVVTQGISGEELAVVFAAARQEIAARPIDPNIDKEELEEAIARIETEADKGEEANESKLERWIRNLAHMAPDIVDVMAASLAGPIAGGAMVLKKIINKVKSEQGADA